MNYSWCVCFKYSSHFSYSASFLEALCLVVIAIKRQRLTWCLSDSSFQGKAKQGEKWWDTSHMNNKALRLGGRHAEVMHNSSGILIKSPFLCPLQLLGTRGVISFLALPPPFPWPWQLRRAAGFEPQAAEVWHPGQRVPGIARPFASARWGFLQLSPNWGSTRKGLVCSRAESGDN